MPQQTGFELDAEQYPPLLAQHELSGMHPQLLGDVQQHLLPEEQYPPLEQWDAPGGRVGEVGALKMDGAWVGGAFGAAVASL